MQSRELHHLYHNRELDPLEEIPREYPFARLAYDFFPHIRPFLQKKVRRRLRLHTGREAWVESGLCEQYCERQGASRSASPRKRKAHDVVVEAVVVEAGTPDSGVDLGGHVGYETEGYKTKRSCHNDDHVQKQRQHQQHILHTNQYESRSEVDDDDDDDDAYGHRGRCEAEEMEALFTDSDLHGTKRKRRREIEEEAEEKEEGGLVGGYDSFDDDDDDDDLYGRRQRREAEETEALFTKPDPYGTKRKRRREIEEETEEEEEKKPKRKRKGLLVVITTGRTTLIGSRYLLRQNAGGSAFRSRGDFQSDPLEEAPSTPIEVEVLRRLLTGGALLGKHGSGAGGGSLVGCLWSRRKS